MYCELKIIIETENEDFLAKTLANYCQDCFNKDNPCLICDNTDEHSYLKICNKWLIIAKSVDIHYASCINKPGWRNRHTRQSQKLLEFLLRVGSNPTLGTKN